MVSVCTGAFALAAAGLLDRRRAAKHWQYASELAARYPAVKVNPDVLWVDDGDVLTSAGLAAGIDLCVQIVRTDYSSDAAVGVARYLVVAPHRDGGQAQWLERPVPPPGQSLADTCEWALGHLSEPLTVAVLAGHAGWAPRTFSRRFVAETGMAPLRWVTAPRVREARRLLEVSDLPVDEVAARTGLGSAANLRLHLARDAGTTPTVPPTRAANRIGRPTRQRAYSPGRTCTGRHDAARGGRQNPDEIRQSRRSSSPRAWSSMDLRTQIPAIVPGARHL